MINSIDPSPFDKGKAYVAATSYKFGDYTPYLYKTEDYGETWTLITKGIKDNYHQYCGEKLKKEKACFMQELNGECILVLMMEIHGQSFSLIFQLLPLEIYM